MTAIVFTIYTFAMIGVGMFIGVHLMIHALRRGDLRVQRCDWYGPATQEPPPVPPTPPKPHRFREWSNN